MEMTKPAKPLKKKPADEAADLPAAIPKGYLNTSQIQLRTGVTRATIRTRLAAAGILPHPSSTEKEKFYKWDATAEAIVLKTENPYTEARIDNTAVKTERERLKLEQEKGELLSRRDVVNETSILFGTLHKKIAVQNVKELVKSIRNAKTAAEAETLARAMLNQPFMDARDNHPKFIEDHR